MNRPVTTTWKGSLIAVIVATVGVTAMTGLLFARNAAGNDEGALRAPMPVSTTSFSSTESYTREQRFLGLVQAANRSDVGFEVAGTVASMNVQEGDTVPAGTVLATLDRQSLEARRSAASARVTQIGAELELAQGRTQRQAPLRESGAIAAQAFDDTRLAEQALEAALSAARADLRAIDIDLEKTRLRAPYHATVARKHLDDGAVARPGAPVFTLVANASREAHIGIAVEQAQGLQTGASYPVNWRGSSFQATLRAVRPDINPVSMTAVAIFDLPATIDAFDGEPVSVTLPRRVPESGGWLPLSALLEGERGVWTVLRLEPTGAALRSVREVVEVLHVSGHRAFVRGTISDGDEVIDDGVHRIAPGTAVRRAEA